MKNVLNTLEKGDFIMPPSDARGRTEGDNPTTPTGGSSHRSRSFTPTGEVPPPNTAAEQIARGHLPGVFGAGRSSSREGVTTVYSALTDPAYMETYQTYGFPKDQEIVPFSSPITPMDKGKEHAQGSSDDFVASSSTLKLDRGDQVASGQILSIKYDRHTINEITSNDIKNARKSCLDQTNTKLADPNISEEQKKKYQSIYQRLEAALQNIEALSQKQPEERVRIIEGFLTSEDATS